MLLYAAVIENIYSCVLFNRKSEAASWRVWMLIFLASPDDFNFHILDKVMRKIPYAISTPATPSRLEVSPWNKCTRPKKVIAKPHRQPSMRIMFKSLIQNCTA